MRTHLLVIHRWRDRHAHYESYIDHDRHRVTYITTELGRASVPDGAAEVVTVAATDDLGLVRPVADALAARFGRPERVVALNEGDLDTAALLREHLGCAGQTPGELARFRDKLTMVETVAAAGIPVPVFADAPGPDAVHAFAAANGWPLVVKPRRGTASRGVLLLDGPGDVDRMSALDPEPRLVQVYCADPIFHIDGLWTGNDLGPWRASRYLNTCVGFTTGDVLGSVEVDDSDLLKVIGEFTAAVAGALSDEPWVFHLEAFVGEEDGEVRLTFLEAGYRVGGAEIPFVWREVHGIDLMAAAVDVQLGRAPSLREPIEWATGGWLLVPAPVPAPCRVVVADLQVAPGAGPYAHVVPAAGCTVPKVGGYEHVGGRFRFRGRCTDEVETAIVRTASGFRLECVPA